jgi:inactivated superfamily I helicase
MTKLEELMAAIDAAYEAWDVCDDASTAAYYDAWDAYLAARNAAWCAYYTELKKTKEQTNANYT